MGQGCHIGWIGWKKYSFFIVLAGMAGKPLKSVHFGSEVAGMPCQNNHLAGFWQEGCVATMWVDLIVKSHTVISKHPRACFSK